MVTRYIAHDRTRNPASGNKIQSRCFNWVIYSCCDKEPEPRCGGKVVCFQRLERSVHRYESFILCRNDKVGRRREVLQLQLTVRFAAIYYSIRDRVSHEHKVKASVDMLLYEDQSRTQVNLEWLSKRPSHRCFQ
jgi:hypothetical protein